MKRVARESFYISNICDMCLIRYLLCYTRKAIYGDSVYCDSREWALTMMRYLSLSYLTVFIIVSFDGLIPWSFGFHSSAATQSRNTSSFQLNRNKKRWNLTSSSENSSNRVSFDDQGSIQSLVPSPEEEEDSRTYFLLNTKQIWQQIFINTIILFVLKFIISKLISPVATSCCNRYGTSISFMENITNIKGFPSATVRTGIQTCLDLFLPLMSSACCAIQLILNAIGVGCAGFNTVLGPLRPYFVSILIFKSMKIHSMKQKMDVARFVGTWSLALLPEVVHFINNRRVSKRRMISNGELHGNSKRLLVNLNIPTMGCVACINKIDTTIQNFEHAIDGSSKLNSIGKGGTGTVLLECSNDTDAGTITKKLIESLTNAGFPCEIESISEE